MPDDDINWPAPEDLSDQAFFPYASAMLPPQYPEHFDPSSFESTDDFNPYSQHVDLEKITEFEKWESPLAESKEIKVETKEIQPRYSASFSPYDPYYPRSAVGSRRHSCLSLAASDGTKSRGRSEPSSPSETPQLKRRQSSSGNPVHFLPTDAELELKLEKASSSDKSSMDKSSPEKSSSDKASPENAIPESKPKPSAKASHSLIERKYRENLNSKIIQLDQTLASTRQSKLDTDASDKSAPGKTRKADVLNEAMRYVKQAELESLARIKEIDFLRLRVAALEKLVGCGDCSLLKQFANQKIDRSTDY